MSSIRAEMSGDTDELLQRLNRLSHLETRGVLNSIAEGLRTSTVERFTEEKTPEGTSWKPSIRAQEEGGKTLTKTTQLLSLIHIFRELYQDMESPELEDLIQQGIYLSHLIGRSMD